jgi:hypothetical protein
VTQRVTSRVTRWRDGDMRLRWCVAGLLRAESKFRRVNVTAGGKTERGPVAGGRSENVAPMARLAALGSR